MSVLAQRGAAQEASSLDTTVYEVVEKWPEYPGGLEQLMKDVQRFGGKYIKKHFPDKNPYSGTPAYRYLCVAKFIVHEDGRVSDAVIVKSLEPHTDRAALLFVKSMPRWTPGEHKGRKVKVRYTLPFSLCLQ